MTRNERFAVEKRLSQMAEEMHKFYRDNVPNGGILSVIFSEDGYRSIYNQAAYDDEHNDVIDVNRSEDGTYSIGHDDYSQRLRTKEGEWFV